MANVTGHTYTRKGKRGEVWYAKFRLPSGRQRKLRLGPAWTERGRCPEGHFTKRKAEAELREILVRAAHGEIPDESPRRGPTFGDACEAWLEHRRTEKGSKPSTLRDYGNFAESAKRALGADTPLEAIGEDRMATYKVKRLADVSRRTAQKEMVMLHGIFDVARKPPRRWITDNPCADIPKITVRSSGDFNVLDPAQAYAVAEAAPTLADRALILVACLAGLRLGELRALRWESVRFDLGSIMVRDNYTGDEGTPKSGLVRTVPLMDDVAAALDKLSQRAMFTQPGDLVFGTELGEHRSGDEIRDMFYAALDAAGLGHLRESENPIVFHDTRHSFGTIAVQVWPVTDVKAMMGHKDIQTTMRYVHHQPRHAAAQEFTAAVRRMAQGPKLGPEIGPRMPTSEVPE